MTTATEAVGILTASALLENWQGHRRLTRRVIDAFPEDKLFQFSLGGVASRNYQIQASADLINWSVLSTFTDSNANGIIIYSDSAATNLSRRFYRGVLLP